MTQTTWDTLWINVGLVTCEHSMDIIPNAAIATHDGKIAWLGPMTDLPHHQTLDGTSARQVFDGNGRCLTPGLIDCHTHVIYGGNRAHEFAERLKGVSYATIAKQGGGIQSTVKATRELSKEALFTQSAKRIQTMLENGVTTIEIKSGYGLDLETELKMLRVALQIEQHYPLTIVKTFLGAHTLPPEYRDQAEAYVDLICEKMLPAVASEKLAEAVDVFCESIAFNLQQTERIFNKARDLQLNIKCHAEQLSHSGASKLAARYQALSVDHLEYLAEEDIVALKQSQTVAVLLPGAYYYLRETTLPPVEKLREARVPIAIATDCNPGTSPILSLLLILNMACTLFRLTPEEAFLGVTRNAAKALGLEKTHGTLTVGKWADFAIWDASAPIELIYQLGSRPLYQLVKQGKICYAI